MKPVPKTNAIRLIAAANIACDILSYSVDEDHLDALTAARLSV